MRLLPHAQRVHAQSPFDHRRGVERRGEAHDARTVHPRADVRMGIIVFLRVVLAAGAGVEVDDIEQVLQPDASHVDLQPISAATTATARLQQDCIVGTTLVRRTRMLSAAADAPAYLDGAVHAGRG